MGYNFYLINDQGALCSGRSRNPLKTVPMEFHILKKIRDKYDFDDTFFALSGNVILENFHAVRLFTHKLNEKIDLIKYPEKAVRSSQINAMGLIDEILHYVIYLYRQEADRTIFEKGLAWITERCGKAAVEKTLMRFSADYPSLSVYKKGMNPADYLEGTTEGVSNRQIILEEMIMLWIANANPAFEPYQELFDDSGMKNDTAYEDIMKEMDAFFQTQPKFGPDSQFLLDMLRSPAIAVPFSLRGQLEYIRERWGMLLGKFFFRLLSSLDLITEEEKMRGFGKAGLLEPYNYASADSEYERFSADKEWMPKVVLMAKCTLVWLDQLSKKYKRSIQTLDQIPDEELDQLARYGFTGLWLIGLWERSKASRTIKQFCGNPDAEASAYSLFDYAISNELGGFEALRNLQERCWKRGIRLASDMVPNHTGIDSKWVIEHPDWFVSLNYPPFPAYTFNGHNYSTDPGVGMFVEDHYYNRSDASVVFKRVDFHTGDTKYIYHGNDGTHMPWNDTAQLNFLNAETREAVMQTIIQVARMFPIIRFDAAMTLTKRHYQRLWFPVPGSGGDIPSRAEHGMTKAQFDAAFPQEFWREVVDRIAAEVPDTLLLAEAFWLMEGYFVRTLGMHRVYNSAFMNMLKMEDNQKYRLTIKNTIEFDPEILKRFVNFMNNPDEETAVNQFGKGDKYFGACMMMVTMPGLPMFGHGQIEGFSEKYGMEYRRAYWNETEDRDLIRRHEREIFPLMKKRHIFSGVDNFLLYDFYSPEGWVNEDVFAFTNRSGIERALVIFNNRFNMARGWIKTSAAYAVKKGSGDEKNLSQKVLGDGLALHNDGNYYCIFRDLISGLEYIRNSKALWDNGLYAELGAFKYHVFMDFREVCDNEYRHYTQVAQILNGRGVVSIDEELKEIFLKPIYVEFNRIANKDLFKQLESSVASVTYPEINENLLKTVEGYFIDFFKQIKEFWNAPGDPVACGKKAAAKLEVVQKFRMYVSNYLTQYNSTIKSVLITLNDSIQEFPYIFHVLYGWVIVHSLGEMQEAPDSTGQSRSWIDEWLLGKKLSQLFQELGMEEEKALKAVQIIKVLTSHQNWFVTDQKTRKEYAMLNTILFDPEVRQFIKVNMYQDVLWFAKEEFDELANWLLIIALVKFNAGVEKEKVPGTVLELFKTVKKWMKEIGRAHV
jgi:glycosidase